MSPPTEPVAHADDAQDGGSGRDTESSIGLAGAAGATPAAGSEWLGDREQHVWRRWLRLTTLLPGVLHRELQADAGLSLPDFDVLVQLTDDPLGRVRVSDLAAALHWERSRVSHHVTRMQRRGLVQREECSDDGRGAFVALTAEGRSAIERAAPGHVRTVRRLVFDDLDEREIEAFDAVIGKILERLGDGTPR